MTFYEFCNTQEDILDSYCAGELTEKQLEHEMEMLQEQYENECEED